MPTNVDSYSMQRALLGIKRALDDIKQSAGYNTSPRVFFGPELVEKVAEFPSLAIEMGDLSVSQEQLGGGEQGLIYFDWPAMIWGYIQSSEGRAGLYRAGAALLADVQSAIYADETLPDGAGQGSVLFAHPGDVTFDMESFSAITKGYFVAEFQLTIAVTRGANP